MVATLACAPAWRRRTRSATSGGSPPSHRLVGGSVSGCSATGSTSAPPMPTVCEGRNRAGLRRQDRYHDGLHGRDRPLRVRRHHQEMANARVPPGRALPETRASSSPSPATRRRRPRAFVACQADVSAAGQGAHDPEITGPIWRRTSRSPSRTRQVHGLLLLRVDLAVRQAQPAPKHLLPQLRQGADRALLGARLVASGGALVDGRPAQGESNELLAISHETDLEQARIPPPTSTALGRPIDAAWAESRMRSVADDQGAVRSPWCCRPTTSSRTTRSTAICWGFPRGLRPHQAGRQFYRQRR